MKSSLAYARITAKAVRKVLTETKGCNDKDLPSEKNIGRILNRMGYNLRRVRKSRPVRKIRQADEISENVWETNRQSDDDPESLRISADAKAKVSIGEFSRNGESRGPEAGKAADHDMNPECELVPCGILNVVSGLLTVFRNFF